MTWEAADEVARRGGVATRRELAALPRGRLARDVSAGRVVRVLPRTYVGAGITDQRVRWRSALAWAGPPAAISHLSALQAWALPAPDRDAVDVEVPHGRRLAGNPARVTVHRTRAAGAVVERAGLCVVSLERAVVASWPLLDADAQRAPALVACRERRTSPDRLAAELARHPRLHGRAGLAELLRLLETGCESELEVWGHRHAFTGPAFTGWRWQMPFRLDGRSVRLDLYDDRARLAVELDGRRYHDDPSSRERDVRRDAALAEHGVLTVRLTSQRLRTEPAACREQVLRISALRRRELGGRPRT